MTAMPVAQFPDIVPPQVRVTATYPGASAQAVEESVAQVDRGAGQRRRAHDLHEVDVGRRRQLHAHRQLRGRLQSRHQHRQRQQPRQPGDRRCCRPRCSAWASPTKKQSSALLQVVAVYSPKGTRDALFLSNFATINVLDTLRRVPGVGDATLFGALDYSMRIWLEPRPHVEPRHHARTTWSRRSRRRTCRPPSAGSARRRCSTTSASSSTSPPRAGSPRSRSSSNIVVRANARRRAAAGQRHRPRRAGPPRPATSIGRYNGKPAAGIQHLPAARRQCAGHRRGRARRDQGAGAALPRRCRLQRHVRHHGVRRRPRSRA